MKPLKKEKGMFIDVSYKTNHLKKKKTNHKKQTNKARGKYLEFFEGCTDLILGTNHLSGVAANT